MSRVYVLNGHNGQERAKSRGPASRPSEVGSVPVASAIEGERVTQPVTARFVLIDRQPLRCACLVTSLERWDVGGRTVPLSSAAEIAPLLTDGGAPIELVILSIGGMTVDDAPVADDLRRLRTEMPQVPVVLLAERGDRESILAALRVGVRGYLPTSVAPEVVRHALGVVLAGSIYAPVEPFLTNEHRAAARLAEPSEPVSYENGSCGPLGNLTPRQRQVLELLGQGRPNKVIAQRLAMCESTVKVHVRQIMRKLGARNRTEVALKLRELVPQH